MMRRRDEHPATSWLSFQSVGFLINAFIFTCICCVPLVLGETHWILTNIENGKIQPVPNSPLCLRQPHSLVDLLNANSLNEQITEAYEEVHATRKTVFETIVNAQEANEKSEDPSCKSAKPLKFEEKTFTTFLEYDLMPALLEPKTYISPPLARDILTPSMLRKLLFGPLERKKGFEPHCENVIVETSSDGSYIHASDLFTSYPYYPEPYLINLTPENLIHLGELISAAMDNDNYKFFGLYYAGFYWRYHGNAVEAASCFQKCILMTMNNAGVYALANMHYLAGDYHHALAAFKTRGSFFLGSVALPAQWYNAAADVMALTGDLEHSIDYYTEALKMTIKSDETNRISRKRYLVNCAVKNIEPIAIEQSAALLKLNNAIETMNDLRQKLQHIRLPADEYLKNIYAYEQLTHGPLNGMSCQTVLKNGLYGQTKAIDCRMTNAKTYNASLATKKKFLRREQSLTVQELMDVVNRGPIQRAEFLTYVLDGHVAFDKYYKSLAPFVGVVMDEQLSAKKYPPAKKATPVIENIQVGPTPCEGLETFDLQKLYDTEIFDIEPEAFPFFPELVISPDNKGHSNVILLTVLMALPADKVSPLPWSEPFCSTQLNVTDDTQILPGLRISDYTTTRIPDYHEKSLRNFLESLLGGETVQQRALIGDIGHRIAMAFRFQIGSKWMLFNLAATYWRYMGDIREASICLKGALDTGVHIDIALNQLAQLTVRLGPEFIPTAKKIAEEAIKIDGDEPVSRYTLGFLHFLDGSLYRARREFTKTLELEPSFEDAKLALISVACLRRSTGSLETVRNRYRPMCCWPSEQNVYCFTHGDRFLCYRISVRDAAGRVLDYQYVRCNGKYTKQSYKVSPLYRFLMPLYVSVDELDQLLLQSKLNNISRQETDSRDELPVIPLDYGGFDPIKLAAYGKGLPNMANFEQSMTDYGDARKERLQKEAENSQLQNAILSEQEFEEGVRIIQGIYDHRQIISLDVELPAFLPAPTKELIAKGLKYLNPPKPNTLADYCVMADKNRRVLDHPSPTYISVTAKGVRLEDYIDPTTPVTSITASEPICSDVEADDEWRALDDLPAYRFRQHFRFYKPETPLIDALMSLGNKHEKIEHVAARLHLALKTSKLNRNGEENGIVSAASTLYWRVKGDAVNGLRCLRHALKYLPTNLKDTALISMANIYHQAGFLHSALIAGSKAHQRTPDMVVVHFTLANIYATMGDYKRALQFYYSTLALQPSFQQAKERIRAIYCLTHGKVTI